MVGRSMTVTNHNAVPTMGAGGARASEAGDALDEQRFTPPNIEARPSASGEHGAGATLEVVR